MSDIFNRTASPFKLGPLAIAGIVSGGVNIVGGLLNRRAARKEEDRAREAADERQRKMDQLKDVYSSLDTSNPYLNMENKFEDLTVNQQQYDLERQQFQQSQANILDNMKGAAGGGGAAAVAQALAQQGQLAAQKTAAQIGAQERENLLKERQAASSIQSLEREGEVKSRDWERNKQATLLGMAQQETAAAREREAMAAQAKRDATTQMLGSLGDIGAAVTGNIV